VGWASCGVGASLGLALQLLLGVELAEEHLRLARRRVGDAQLRAEHRHHPPRRLVRFDRAARRIGSALDLLGGELAVELLELREAEGLERSVARLSVALRLVYLQLQRRERAQHEQRARRGARVDLEAELAARSGASAGASAAGPQPVPRGRWTLQRAREEAEDDQHRRGKGKRRNGTEGL
jgi:hypothetical protein